MPPEPAAAGPRHFAYRASRHSTGRTTTTAAPNTLGDSAHSGRLDCKNRCWGASESCRRFTIPRVVALELAEDAHDADGSRLQTLRARFHRPGCRATPSTTVIVRRGDGTSRVHLQEVGEPAVPTPATTGRVDQPAPPPPPDHPMLKRRSTRRHAVVGRSGASGRGHDSPIGVVCSAGHCGAMFSSPTSHRNDPRSDGAKPESTNPFLTIRSVLGSILGVVI